MALAFAAALLGFGGWGIWYAHGQNTIFRWLCDYGTHCTGRVRELVEVNTGKGMIRTYLTFSFATSAGELMRGRTEYLAAGQLPRWSAGDGIHVWYNPARPEQFTINLNEPAHE